MSKIFDALQREHGELSDRILASIRDDTHEVSEPACEHLANNGNGSEIPVRNGAEQPTSSPAYRTVQLSPTESVLTFSDQPNLASEQFRILRTKVVQHLSRPRILLVSSAAAGDGKTMTAINLALALSLKGQDEVLLLDGDFRRPSVAVKLGLPPDPGIADVIGGACRFQDAVIRAEQFPSLCVLPAGKAARNPAELLDSAEWRLLIARIREAFRYVVIDSPPISTVADYDLLQAVADGVILTASPDHTPRKPLFKAIERVPPEKLLGVVLNRVPKWFFFKSFGHEYYNYKGKKAAPKQVGDTAGPPRA